MLDVMVVVVDDVSLFKVVVVVYVVVVPVDAVLDEDEVEVVFSHVMLKGSAAW